ncbi:MAG: hypothetical protein J1F69_01600 [Clostridiales bacterium]|nr:hypothetical protein [Clostridiales bacterium]
MKKLMDNKTYPANVLMAVFGDKTEETTCYFDEAELNGTIDRIVCLLTDDARSVFYALYREHLSESDIAKRMSYTTQKVHNIHSLVLRELRRPKNSMLLKKYTGLFRVVPIDGKALGQLTDGTPIILTAQGEARAVVMSMNLYDRLISKTSV